ncbi:hypothetical protein OHT76_35490 [Streptomyces sp. NBC_00287]|uniref:hypothetical protein n=1 Tax=Streptomyces sp. NBC_00287 TaxID=2975702 RepID=UPI002E29679E|nr:hypothetical protein [Streptomyces sp. NBC_00287]
MVRDKPLASPDPHPGARQDSRLGHLLWLAQVKLASSSRTLTCEDHATNTPG